MYSVRSSRGRTNALAHCANPSQVLHVHMVHSPLRRSIELSLLMATVAAGCSTSRARKAASRSSFVPGFYRALHSQTAANCFTATERPSLGLTLPQVAGAADPELPLGCYLVERLIATRKNKVCYAYKYCWNLQSYIWRSWGTIFLFVMQDSTLSHQLQV